MYFFVHYIKISRRLIIQSKAHSTLGSPRYILETWVDAPLGALTTRLKRLKTRQEAGVGLLSQLCLLGMVTLSQPGGSKRDRRTLQTGRFL